MSENIDEDSNKVLCPYCQKEIEEKIFDDHMMCHEIENEGQANNDNNSNNNINQQSNNNINNNEINNNNINNNNINNNNINNNNINNNVNNENGNNNNSNNNGGIISSIINFFGHMNNNNQNNSNANDNREESPTRLERILSKISNVVSNIPGLRRNFNYSINQFSNSSSNSTQNRVVYYVTQPLVANNFQNAPNNNINNNPNNNSNNIPNNNNILFPSNLVLPPNFANFPLPPLIIGERGHVYNPSEQRNNVNIDAIMNLLPSSEVKEKKEGENNNCIICLNDFEIGDNVTSLPCLHVYHTDCIKSWLKSKNHCPICKYTISEESLRRGN